MGWGFGGGGGGRHIYVEVYDMTCTLSFVLTVLRGAPRQFFFFGQLVIEKYEVPRNMIRVCLYQDDMYFLFPLRDFGEKRAFFF